YPTAAAFESDLLAFVENRPTAAQREGAQSWDSNATIEKPGAEPVARPRWVWLRRMRPLWLSVRSGFHADWDGVLATMAGAPLGLLLFMPLAYLYRFYTVSDPLRRPKNYMELNQASIVSDWNLYLTLRQQDRPLGRLAPVSLLTESLHAKLVSAADGVIE